MYTEVPTYYNSMFYSNRFYYFNTVEQYHYDDNFYDK